MRRAVYYSRPKTLDPKPSCHSRRASALAEFVLFLPFLLFILLMTFHFVVSKLRKQRTIVAARFSNDAVLRGIGEGGADSLRTDSILAPRRVWTLVDLFPDPQNHLKGLYDEPEIQRRFLTRVPVEGVLLERTFPDDGLDRLKREVDQRDVGIPLQITRVTGKFWDRQFEGTTGVHAYARGTRVQANYAPRGQTFEKLQGPITSHVFREAGPWSFHYPDMWHVVVRSESELANLEDIFEHQFLEN